MDIRGYSESPMDVLIRSRCKCPHIHYPTDILGKIRWTLLSRRFTEFLQEVFNTSFACRTVYYECIMYKLQVELEDEHPVDPENILRMFLMAYAKTHKLYPKQDIPRLS
ncbi:uncharacterized protein LOC112494856 [Cephus cinctus]|uniref:Uncharacterized protein LOC112494856 n=1 Tax=Cephus cinctus TaxID=211228 RepID=A0AAJ7W4I2_CEPCN|nr:uncharacterized protein LOC112494856 [Cephus cinctus]